MRVNSCVCMLHQWIENFFAAANPAGSGTSVHNTNMGSQESEISECIQRLCKIFLWMVFYVFWRWIRGCILIEWLFCCCFVAAALLSTPGKQQYNSKLTAIQQQQTPCTTGGYRARKRQK